MDFLSRCLDLLAPRRCCVCDQPLGQECCSECAAAINGEQVRSVGGIPVFSRGSYLDPLAAAVRRLKYTGRSDVADGLGRLLVDVPGLYETTRATHLVPVPLHRKRLAQRGYNQSALLARSLGKRLRLPVRYDLLRRVLEGEAQASSSATSRRLNVRGAFAAIRGSGEVTLVDDVVTTGATALECMRALEATGRTVRAVVAICSTPK